VDQSLAVSGLFLREGQDIVSVRTRGQPNEVAHARGRHISSSIPLVALVDGNSASATEIVAGALQDHDRALLVGTTSFGKGLVQSVFPLDGGYSLKMTTGKWFTPSGRSIHRDRKFVDGHFVDSKIDSVESDSARRARPIFKSDAGRTVYGGGGITPDVIVPDDTLSTVEQQFMRAIAPKAQAVQTVLGRYALELKGTVQRDFQPTPEWTTELFRRLSAAGVTVDEKYSAASAKILTRELVHRVARQAFGDGEAKKREVSTDHQLSTAVDLLRRSTTQQELLIVARSKELGR
jgi:carboxyl-terminal processing protease